MATLRLGHGAHHSAPVTLDCSCRLVASRMMASRKRPWQSRDGEPPPDATRQTSRLDREARRTRFAVHRERSAARRGSSRHTAVLLGRAGWPTAVSRHPGPPSRHHRATLRRWTSRPRPRCTAPGAMPKNYSTVPTAHFCPILSTSGIPAAGTSYTNGMSNRNQQAHRYSTCGQFGGFL
jgi:hypothetical protein